MDSNCNYPLSIENILAGIIIALISEIALAWILQDARFSSRIDTEPAIPRKTVQIEVTSVPTNLPETSNNNEVILGELSGKWDF